MIFGAVMIFVSFFAKPISVQIFLFLVGSGLIIVIGGGKKCFKS